MKKILIIEDHADMRELLTWQIELMGFVPIPARRGRDRSCVHGDLRGDGCWRDVERL